MSNEPKPSPWIGREIFGSYKIAKQIGEGGFGAVFLAKSQRLGKSVAVKIILKERIHRADLIDRFFDEAKAAAALLDDWPTGGGECPLVNVIDADYIDDHPYIVMEYLKGLDLHRWLKSYEAQHRRPLDLDTALSILAQTCCGLEAVHHKSIVHRDLKPANLFVVSGGILNRLSVKILDFGIAKLSDSHVKSSAQTFEAQPFMGSPSYAAPEQIRQMSTVDVRADIYSLGVIAYNMLCGVAPYAVPRQLTGDDLFRLGLPKEITHPVQHRKDLPLEWNKLIMQMLSHESRARPSSALLIALQLADSLPSGNGREIIGRVAPLLLSEEWLTRTKKLSQDILGDAPSNAATGDRVKKGQLPGGDTVSYSAAPPTTLASAAAELATLRAPQLQQPMPLQRPPAPSRKPWLGGLLAAGLAIAVIVTVGTILKRSPSDAKEQATVPQKPDLPSISDALDASLASSTSPNPKLVTSADAAPTDASTQVKQTKRVATRRPRPSPQPTKSEDLTPKIAPTPKTTPSTTKTPTPIKNTNNTNDFIE